MFMDVWSAISWPDWQAMRAVLRTLIIATTRHPHPGPLPEAALSEKLVEGIEFGEML
jgi:hypothetical protein